MNQRCCSEKYSLKLIIIQFKLVFTNSVYLIFFHSFTIQNLDIFSVLINYSTVNLNKEKAKLNFLKIKLDYNY